MGRPRQLIMFAAAAFLQPMSPAAAAERWAAVQARPIIPACTCRYKGEHVRLGSRRCLTTPDGPRMAECVKELNVMSWRSSDEHCPEASMQGGFGS